jgi:gamma-glutamyltranspeptidase / glutathione hydrolase
MKLGSARIISCIFLTILSSINMSSFAGEISWYASGNGGAVAAGPKESARAGIYILSRGGNAVDAAVATIFSLAVCDYGSFCIGGEVPFMLYNVNDRKVIVFNGMGAAPSDQKAIDWYYANGIPGSGIRSSTVPSAVSTLLAALELKGTMSFEDVIGPTLELLDKGVEKWHPNLAKTLRRLISTEKTTTGTRELKIRAARDRFYKGDIADELNSYYISSGAFLRKTDLEAHKTRIEEPVTVKYRGYDVYKCGTWTQGPVLLQSLRLLEYFDLKAMGFLSADYVHVTTEAMKLAFADRDAFYGDPDFVNVPIKQLLSDQYSKLRYPLIGLKSASMEIRPGDPYNMKPVGGTGQFWPGEKGTTTCVVADKWGNVVAATPSANQEYGVCESLGIAHNTRLSSLNVQNGHPNSLAAGKRPRITLTPTIVLRNGKPVLAISVAGGDMQDQVALQLILDYIEFGFMPKDAITLPRFRTYHTQDSFNPSANSKERYFKTGGLDIDSTREEVMDELKKRGHILTLSAELIGDPVMIFIDQSTGLAYAAGEPRYARGKFCGALDLPDKGK